MSVKVYTIADYHDFLSGRQPWPWAHGVLPVSWQRVASHVRNPRADEDDVVLLVAYDEDDNVVSYLGILPDYVFLPDGRRKFGWMTTWWVDPQTDGATSVLLLIKAISLYANRLGVSHYSKRAERVYAALGDRFTTIVPRTVSLFDLRPDFAAICARRVTRAGPVLFACRWLTRLSDAWFTLRGWLWQRSRRDALSGLRFEYVGSLAGRSREFLERFDRSRELFRRDADELEWILTHKWSLVTPLNDMNHGRYQFSGNTRRADYFPLHIYRVDGSLGGLLILSIRDDMLKVPYAFVEEDLRDAAGLLICLHAQALQARTLLLVDKKLAGAVRRQAYPAFRVKTYPRNSLSTLKEPLPEEIDLQDGDGDSAFT